jgi:hypothetical protein
VLRATMPELETTPPEAVAYAAADYQPATVS